MTLRVHPDEIVERSSSHLLAIHPSWERVRLSEIADVLNGLAFKSASFDRGEGVPLLRIRDVGRNDTDTKYTGEYDPAYLVEPGAIVIGMDGDFRVARWRGPTALLNQRVCKVTVRDSELYEPLLLLHVLPGYLDAVHAQTSSVTVKHLSSRTVQELPLPLPPLNEQRRIVAAIEEHLSRLDAADASLAAAVRRLDRLIGATLGAAFNRGEVAAIGELGEVVTGSTPSTKRAAYWGDGLPFVTPSDLRHGRTIRGAERHITSIGAESARSLPARAVLVTCIGATIGKTSVVVVPCATNQQINSVVVDESRVLPEFLLASLSSPPGQRLIVDASSSTTMPILNKSKFKALKVHVPSLEEQRRIVQEVEERLSRIDAMRASIERAQRRSAVLRAAILERAFSGELVPQDPADEPAETLLARIRAEKDTSAPATGRRRKTMRP